MDKCKVGIRLWSRNIFVLVTCCGNCKIHTHFHWRPFVKIVGYKDVCTCRRIVEIAGYIDRIMY